MAVLMSMCSAIIEKNFKGGLVVVGQLNLGGSLDMVYNTVNLARNSCWKTNNYSTDSYQCKKAVEWPLGWYITKINIQYYTDLKDCLVKTFQD